MMMLDKMDELGLTQKALAERMGCSQQYISRVLKATSGFSDGSPDECPAEPDAEDAGHDAQREVKSHDCPVALLSHVEQLAGKGRESGETATEARDQQQIGLGRDHTVVLKQP